MSIRLTSTSCFPIFRTWSRARKMTVRPMAFLLYPVIGQELDLVFEGRGHRIAVRTIDLAQDWRGIHDGLLAIIA